MFRAFGPFGDLFLTSQTVGQFEVSKMKVELAFGEAGKSFPLVLTINLTSAYPPLPKAALLSGPYCCPKLPIVPNIFHRFSISEMWQSLQNDEDLCAGQAPRCLVLSPLGAI